MERARSFYSFSNCCSMSCGRLLEYYWNHPPSRFRLAHKYQYCLVLSLELTLPPANQPGRQLWLKDCWLRVLYLRLPTMGLLVSSDDNDKDNSLEELALDGDAARKRYAIRSHYLPVGYCDDILVRCVVRDDMMTNRNHWSYGSDHYT